VLVAFLVVSLALPVLPLHVHQGLGLGTFVVGLVMAAASGLIYLLSLRLVDAPVTSVSILLAGRALLGGAESFVITGALSWGLALAGPQNTGKVIAWIGTAMYGAFALGAPFGVALYAVYGFTAIALATALAPLATLLVVLPPARSRRPIMAALPLPR